MCIRWLISLQRPHRVPLRFKCDSVYSFQGARKVCMHMCMCELVHAIYCIYGHMYIMWPIHAPVEKHLPQVSNVGLCDQRLHGNVIDRLAPSCAFGRCISARAWVATKVCNMQPQSIVQRGIVWSKCYCISAAFRFAIIGDIMPAHKEGTTWPIVKYLRWSAAKHTEMISAFVLLDFSGGKENAAHQI